VILVVDASVALKWFVREEGSDRAAAILESHATLIAPDLIVAEACNAAWRSWRAGGLHPAQRAAVAEKLPAALDAIIPCAGLAPRAMALAAKLDHPAYDCFYLALAEQRAATLVTADRRLLSRVAGTVWADSVDDLARWEPDGISA
jgi:predicted nucleic acid-binding protein